MLLSTVYCTSARKVVHKCTTTDWHHTAELLVVVIRRISTNNYAMAVPWMPVGFDSGSLTSIS